MKSFLLGLLVVVGVLANPCFGQQPPPTPMPDPIGGGGLPPLEDYCSQLSQQILQAQSKYATLDMEIDNLLVDIAWWEAQPFNQPILSILQATLAMKETELLQQQSYINSLNEIYFLSGC